MERKDKLDEFMDENRDMFDIQEPSPEIWQRLNTEIRRDISPPVSPRKNKVLTYSARAAAVAAIFGASYMFHRYIDKPSEKQTVAIVKPDSTVLQQAYEFQEAESFYVVQVSNKMKELEQFAKDYPDVMTELKTEMKHLDEEYKKLQGDLGEGISNQEIVDAMIQNYRLKLEILERMKDFFNKQNVKTNGKHDI